MGVADYKRKLLWLLGVNSSGHQGRKGFKWWERAGRTFQSLDIHMPVRIREKDGGGIGKGHPLNKRSNQRDEQLTRLGDWDLRKREEKVWG